MTLPRMVGRSFLQDLSIAREGKLMLTAAIAIAKHRKAGYRKLKRAHKTDLLPVSPDLPQITIIVDEGDGPERKNGPYLVEFPQVGVIFN
ncbi:hypothetical protein [Nonomuraea fuscirosea]|uniref:hypothetical protein n=1 Tax=Nonomuraea fuscirosea TaxID=1291556 RepID=UPI0034488918